MIVKVTRDRWNDGYRVVVYDAGIDISITYTKAILIDAKDFDDLYESSVMECVIEAKEVKVDRDNIVMIETK